MGQEITPHDLGGRTDMPAIPRAVHDRQDWEALADAVRMALSAKQLLRMDEIRRATESLSPERYERMSYYERRVAALEIVILEKGLVSAAQLEQRLCSTGSGA